jgi:hypothetical protein
MGMAGRRKPRISDIIPLTHESFGSGRETISVIVREHPAENISVSTRINGKNFKKVTSNRLRGWRSIRVLELLGIACGIGCLKPL